MRMRTWVTVLALGAVAGCVTVPQMSAVDLAAHAQQNVFEAQANLAGRLLIVRGVVKEATLATRERREFSASYNGGPPASLTRGEQMPLVVLQPGSVLCYFEPADISEVSQIRAGDAVAFECQVDSFKPMQQMTVSMLAGCRRSTK